MCTIKKNGYLFLCLLIVEGYDPRVPSKTKVVLRLRNAKREFLRAPHKWDIRLHKQDGLFLILEVLKTIYFHTLKALINTGINMN